MSNIVNYNISVQQAPSPSALLQTGAIVSVGATTLTPYVAGTAGVVLGNNAQGSAFLTNAAALAALLAASKSISTMTWASGTVTVTTATPHGLLSSEANILLTLSGNTVTGGTAPAGYNGTFPCTVTGTSTFTYPYASNPGTLVTGGTMLIADEAQLQNQVNEYFTQAGGAQSSPVGIYVLELGDVNPSDGIALLNSFRANNPNLIYTFLLPNEWASDLAAATAFASMISATSTPNGQVYFYFNISNTTNLWTGKKSAVVCKNSPNYSGTESLAAALMAILLNYSPSLIHRVPQAAYSFLYGCTVYPSNSIDMAAMEANNINYAASGAEGGLSNVILKKGEYSDGNQLNYWYAIDWCDINGHIDLANAIINGSNNTLNPLYYTQQGINTLTAVLQRTVNRGVSFGLIGGAPVVNAIPYTTYTQANPNDYSQGIYNGLSVTFATQTGFLTISFSVVIATNTAQ